MKYKILRIDFSQRAKDLYYMVKYELKPDRAYKKKEFKIARAIACSAYR